MTTNLKTLPLLIASTLLTATIGYSGNIDMRVCPSVAPNLAGSLSGPGYTANAIAGLETGGCTDVGGSRFTDPTAYNSVSYFSPADITVASFPLWEGIANPAAPFAAEGGNRLTFGLIINGNGNQFSLSQLHFDMHSSDPGDVFGYWGDFATDAYGPRRQGFNGATLINSGAATQLVDRLYYVGVGGGSFWPATPADLPASLAAATAIEPYSVTVHYWLQGANNSILAETTASIDSVPEPATITFIGAGLAAFGLFARKRRRQV